MTLLAAANKVMFYISTYMYAWYAYIMVFNRGVPNIRTAPAIRKYIIDLLKEDAAARPAPYVIYDMGSGNGLMTREMAKAMPETKIIGLEWSRQCLFWSRMMARLQRLQNVEYIRADFFKYGMSDASAVVIFLSIYEMGRMGEKLKRELKPGTLVTCNRFKLTGWPDFTAVQVKTLYPFQKNLHIYRQA
jgi:trans-aconitate methyltransferase